MGIPFIFLSFHLTVLMGVLSLFWEIRASFHICLKLRLLLCFPAWTIVRTGIVANQSFHRLEMDAGREMCKIIISRYSINKIYNYSPIYLASLCIHESVHHLWIWVHVFLGLLKQYVHMYQMSCSDFFSRCFLLWEFTPFSVWLQTSFQLHSRAISHLLMKALPCDFCGK